MRALVVTNMYPSSERPAFGSFVRDQVEALRRIDGVSVELKLVGRAGDGYLRETIALAGRRGDLDVVHAHFGLSAWPALAVRGPRHVVTLHGTDLVHPRSRRATLAALPFVDLAATTSETQTELLPRWLGEERRAVLPCGVAVDRFRPASRAAARSALALPSHERLLLFPASPVRAEKRVDRARALAERVGARLLTLGEVSPAEVPTWVNAADAVLVTSERESFGLAALEALACDVPVLSTPVGVAPVAISGMTGALCAPFELERWTGFLRGLLEDPDPRVAGRGVAMNWSADATAAAVLAAWQELC